MEKRIKDYEKFIQTQMKKGVSKDLIEYHRETLQNFQHERLIHLIIMFFFITLTLAMTAVCLFIVANTPVNNLDSLDLKHCLCETLLFPRKPCSTSIRRIKRIIREEKMI